MNYIYKPMKIDDLKTGMTFTEISSSRIYKLIIRKEKLLEDNSKMALYLEDIRKDKDEAFLYSFDSVMNLYNTGKIKFNDGY